jgi:hypothetical protein
VEKPIAKLDNWLEHKGQLIGRVSKHPTYIDGAIITTSPYLWLDRERMEADTPDTRYKLGAESKIQNEGA